MTIKSKSLGFPERIDDFQVGNCANCVRRQELINSMQQDLDDSPTWVILAGLLGAFAGGLAVLLVILP